MSEGKQDESKKEEKPEEDLTGDGGVMKKLIKEGQSWERPKGGAEVQVHYVGTLLDGTKFDSSRDKGTPFSFKLRAGQVIKGWDEAVESMKRGEISRFTLKPNYAYGETGSPPTIPPNATLVFEIELISWVEETDVSRKSDKSIMKKVLKEGDGWERPKRETAVKIHFTVTDNENRVLDDTYSKESGKVLAYRVASGEVPKAVDRIVKTMRKLEVARGRCKASENLAGGTATKALPPDTPVIYTIELVDLVKEKEPWEMNNEEKFQFSAKRREEGNEFFKAGQYKRAAKRYKSALACVQSDHSFSKDEKGKGKEYQVMCLNNIAAAYAKLEKWKEVVDNTTKALEHDPSNVKALLRRANAHLIRSDLEYARRDAKKALEKQPNDKELLAILAKCEAQQKEQDRKDREIYAKMMGGRK